MLLDYLKRTGKYIDSDSINTVPTTKAPATIWVISDCRVETLRYYWRLASSLAEHLVLPHLKRAKARDSRSQFLGLTRMCLLQWWLGIHGLFSAAGNLPLFELASRIASTIETIDPMMITPPITAWLRRTGFLWNAGCFRASTDSSQKARLAPEQAEAAVDAVSWNVVWASMLDIWFEGNKASILTIYKYHEWLSVSPLFPTLFPTIFPPLFPPLISTMEPGKIQTPGLSFRSYHDPCIQVQVRSDLSSHSDKYCSIADALRGFQLWVPSDTLCIQLAELYRIELYCTP